MIPSLMTGLGVWDQDTETVTLGDLLSLTDTQSLKHVPWLDCLSEITANYSVSLHESFLCRHKQQDRKSINFEGDCFPRGGARESA